MCNPTDPSRRPSDNPKYKISLNYNFLLKIIQMKKLKPPQVMKKCGELSQITQEG